MCIRDSTYYVEIYFSNFDPFLRMLACQYYTLPCEFVCYEDGFSSYVIDYLREDRAAINRHPEGQKIRDKVESVFPVSYTHLDVYKRQVYALGLVVFRRNRNRVMQKI